MKITNSKIIIIFVFLISIIITMTFVAHFFNKKHLLITFENNQNLPIIVKAQTATTPRQQIIGLMRHDFLNEDEGMLFIFEIEEIQTFWMKNMKFPIDLIFLDQNKNIISYYEKLPACHEKKCPYYQSAQAAKYAIELPAEFIKKNQITHITNITFNH